MFISDLKNYFNSLLFYFILLNLTLPITLHFIYVFFVIRSKFLKAWWATCFHEFTLVYNEISNKLNITYNHFLAIISFAFLLTLGFECTKSAWYRQEALGVPQKKGLEEQYGRLVSKGAPKVTSRSGHWSSLAGTCPSLDR